MCKIGLKIAIALLFNIFLHTHLLGQVIVDNLENYDPTYYKKIAGLSAFRSTIITNDMVVAGSFSRQMMKGEYVLVVNESYDLTKCAISIKNNDKIIQVKNKTTTNLEFSIESKGIITINVNSKEEVLNNNKEVFCEIHFKYDPQLNYKAPLFEVKDIAGNIYNNKNLKGKIVVLYFWLPSKHLLDDFKELNKAANTYTENTVFLAVSNHSIEELNQLKIDHGIRYKLVGEGVNLRAKFSFNGIITIPHHVIIDLEGNVVFMHLGDNYMIRDILSKELDKVL